MIVYGDGGAGKTTLEVDLALHLAAGADWLGLPVPAPCRVLVLENEGPRGRFRLKLRARLAAWGGPAPSSHLFVVDEPWAGFSFAHPALRDGLVASCAELGVDVLCAAPLHELGTTGGGTPEEVSAFMALIGAARAALARDLAVLLVHHENRAGQISRAWERVPDTMCARPGPVARGSTGARRAGRRSCTAGAGRSCGPPARALPTTRPRSSPTRISARR